MNKTEVKIAMPKVSVIIPAYNKADYTVKAVESVLNQDYGNVECIVIDDGSTDDTWDKLFPFDTKIRYIYKNNGGVSSARNKGIVHSTGEYIAFLDCDDMYLPNKISKSMENVNSGSFEFIHTAAYLIDKNDKPIKVYKPAKTNLLFRNFICNSTPVMRKDVFDEVGLFDEDLFICADWDMWLRINEKYAMYYFNEPLTYYRV